MGEEYDVPWEFTRRTRASLRSSVPSLPQPSDPLQSYTLASTCDVGCVPETNWNRRRSCTQDTQRRKPRIDESCVMKDMDRVEAEKRLHDAMTGDFLLRWRDDNSAALSLRAPEGILHLKLERVREKWMVGEGARFSSIASAISFYRKSPLPIRGATHIRLANCLSIPPQLTDSL